MYFPEYGAGRNFMQNKSYSYNTKVQSTFVTIKLKKYVVPSFMSEYFLFSIQANICNSVCNFIAVFPHGTYH